MTHICVSKLTSIGSDKGLPPVRRQAIIWTNAGILLIGPLRTNFSGIFIEIHAFSFKKMHFKMSSGKWRPFCLGLNVLMMFIHWCLDEVFTISKTKGIQLYFVTNTLRFISIQFHWGVFLITPVKMMTVPTLKRDCFIYWTLDMLQPFSLSTANQYSITRLWRLCMRRLLCVQIWYRSSCISVREEQKCHLPLINDKTASKHVTSAQLCK